MIALAEIEFETRSFTADAAELALLGAGVVFTLLVFTIFVLILRSEMKREKARELERHAVDAGDDASDADHDDADAVADGDDASRRDPPSEMRG